MRAGTLTATSVLVVSTVGREAAAPTRETGRVGR
jgi:hypothetical protein